MENGSFASAVEYNGAISILSNRCMRCKQSKNGKMGLNIRIGFHMTKPGRNGELSDVVAKCLGVVGTKQPAILNGKHFEETLFFDYFFFTKDGCSRKWIVCYRRS